MSVLIVILGSGNLSFHKYEGGMGASPIPMADLQAVTDGDFDSEVADSDRPVLVDFWADWCHPCKLVEPHVEAIAQEYAEKIKVVKLNIDENPTVPGRYGVMSIPTLMLFVDGVEKARIIGAHPKDAIVSELTSYL